MALISNGKKGREDGGFSRVLGNDALGALISRTHGTVITAGTELEKIITRHAIAEGIPVMTPEQFGQLLDKKLTNGKFLLPKTLIKTHLKKIIGTTIEPDFVYLVVNDGNAYIIELKDGDAFDTKKSAGEVKSANSFATALHSYFLQKGLPITYPKVRFCCFNQPDKKLIVAGLKGQIKESEAMTGKELCELIGIDYQAILLERKTDAEANLTFFLQEALKISEIRDFISKTSLAMNGVIPPAPVGMKVSA